MRSLKTEASDAARPGSMEFLYSFVVNRRSIDIVRHMFAE
jgi:hypothetical protein